MTGRERLTNIIRSVPTDRVSWCTLVDDYTRSVMPENIRNLDIMDFYRYIGCDIFQFGNYGFSKTEGVKYPYKFLTPDVIETQEFVDKDGNDVVKRRTRWGDLTSICRKIHPIKYPVQTIEDVRILTKIWTSASFIADETGCLESYAKMDRRIGDNGIFVPTTEPSPIQALLENEMGPENFYYMFTDYKEEMDELLTTMNKVRMQEYSIIAEKMPFCTCIPIENTSTSYISPAIYREYCVPVMRQFTETMHKNGKKAIIHMCGLVNDLLEDIKEIGLDGIHGLTPPSLGNTDFGHAMDVLGEKLMIIGCLDSAVFQSSTATPEEIRALLDRTVTPRLRESNYIMWATADGIPTPIEKFLVIQEWMEKNAGK